MSLVFLFVYGKWAFQLCFTHLLIDQITIWKWLQNLTIVLYVLMSQSSRVRSLFTYQEKCRYLLWIFYFKKWFKKTIPYNHRWNKSTLHIVHSVIHNFGWVMVSILSYKTHPVLKSRPVTGCYLVSTVNMAVALQSADKGSDSPTPIFNLTISGDIAKLTPGQHLWTTSLNSFIYSVMLIWKATPPDAAEWLYPDQFSRQYPATKARWIYTVCLLSYLTKKCNAFKSIATILSKLTHVSRLSTIVT